MKKKTRTLLLCSLIVVLTAVSGLGIWLLTRDKSSVGSGNLLGVEWYHENGTDFTITTADELYELAELSKYYDFEGQTIKLGADIVVNEGNAEDWVVKLPKRMWEPIAGFAGTFDGQGHTISGICGLGYSYGIDGRNVVYFPTGLFRDTQTKCVIRDFKLVNSYFCSDLSQGVGSVTSNGGGTFENIYSDALIVSYKSNNGGIIGVLDAKGSSSITNCWFDGEIRVEGNVGRYTGGMIGRVLANNGQNKIEHCLNTGKISSTVTGRGMNIGGLVGNIQDSGRVTITDCLTVGDIEVNYFPAVGAVIGSVEANGSAIINDVYARGESQKAIIGNVSGKTIGFPIGQTEKQLTGYEGYRWTTLDFENYWTVVEDDTPILQYFADDILSIKGVEKAFDTSWYDQTKSTYTLATVEELYGFAMLSHSTNFTGKTVKLGADIVLNEGKVTDWKENPPENHWVPIGAYSFGFAGIFDGDMHTISGLYYNAKPGYAGLFGGTTENATVKNLKLTNSYIHAEGTGCGSIVAQATGNIDTVYSDAVVIGGSGRVGGLVGVVPTSGGIIMKNCWFDGSVTNTGNTKNDRIVGGLVGIVQSMSTISNCLNTGVVDASVYTFNQNATGKPNVVPVSGGLVGNVQAKTLLTLENCLNVGEVKVSDEATAGYGSVIGYVNGTATVSKTYATKESSDVYNINNSESGQVYGMDTEDITGYKAYQWTLLDFENYWAVVKNGTPILKSFTNDVPSLAGVKKMYDISWYDVNSKTYVLDSREDLYGFYLLSYDTDFEGKTVKLGKDITVNTGNASSWATNTPAYEWIPVGTSKYPFKGTFDGAMHTISGLYQNTNERFAGVFGVTDSTATVKNLKLTNSYFATTNADAGSIVGRGNGTFDTIYSDAIVVSTNSRVGGLIGQMNVDSVVTNCWFDGSVSTIGNTTANRIIGGIVGYVHAGTTKISNCLNTGTVAAPDYALQSSAKNLNVVPLVGGIVGNVASGGTIKMTDCLNVGNIEVNKNATTGYGSIIGYADGTLTVSEVYATSESCDKNGVSSKQGYTIVLEEDEIQGYRAYQWTLLDFDKYWAVVTADTPILKAFASSIPSIAGVDRLIDTSWYDESKNTYVLYDMKDLNGFAYLAKTTNFSGKTVKLGADIEVNNGNASDWANSAPNYAWMSIGSKELPFAGTFDGCMHTISGIYQSTDKTNSGLFGRISAKATVKNVKLTNSYFESTATDFGSIAGVGLGRFDTIYSDAIVVGANARVGGLVGHTSGEDVIMKNCWFAGTVTNSANANGLRGTGGLVGMIYSGKITMSNCLNSGFVDASAYSYNQNTNGTVNIVPLVGGLIGNVRADKTAGTKATAVVKDCLNVGKIKYNSNAGIGYGSIVGFVDGILNISKTYATSDCDKQAEGYNITGKTFVVKEDEIKGYNGYQWTLLDFDKYWAVVTNPKEGTPILKSFANEIPSLADVDKMIDISWYDESKTEYILKDKADLYGLAMLSADTDFKGKTIRLGADIVVNTGNAADWAKSAPSYSWNPIGSNSKPFAGIFDGMDKEGKIHSISGLYINTNTSYVGLFGATNGATIQNLKLTNSYFKTTSGTIGSVAGEGNGTFNTIYSTAVVVGAKAYVGGMVGMTSKTGVTMTNCWYDGSVTNTATTTNAAYRYTGGIIGMVRINSSLTNCLNTGIVDASGYAAKGSNGKVIPLVGGIVGNVIKGKTLTIENCLNTGTIKYHSDSVTGYGSIIGYSDGTLKTDLYSYGTAESCVQTGTSSKTNPKVVKVAQSDILGDKAETKLSGFDFANVWIDVAYSTPVLKTFEKEIIDTGWYYGHEDEDVYVLYDKADLYGFAVLSKTLVFKNKTVRLGADIIVNTGNASDWANGAPNYRWTPIGTKTNPFIGVFDGANPITGEIYTISGIYLKTSEANSGLFARTDSGTIVQNLKLVNSYFESSNSDFGSIAGVGNGTFNNIYSSAIVKSTHARVGGLIGHTSDTSEEGAIVNNCWFDGTVTNAAINTSTSNGLRGTGGIVGVLYSGKLTMTNCANTNTVDAEAYTYNQSSSGTNINPLVGGLLGWAKSGTTLEMTDCLNTGMVKYSKDGSNKVTTGYGSVVGMIEGAATVSKTYATSESCGMMAHYSSKNTSISFGASRIETVNEDDYAVLVFFKDMR